MPRRDVSRRYVVRIDGERVGELLRGQERAFEVAPGEHQVRVSMGPWLRSRSVTLRLEDGDVVDFECRPRASAFVRLFAAVVPVWYLVLDGPLHEA